MDLAGRKVLVTGGAGFVGSHVVDQLIDRGAQVTVLDDLSQGSLDNLAGARERHPQLRVLRGDVSAGWALKEALAGAEVVFHLAVHWLRLSLEQPDRVHEVNVNGTLRLLDQVRRQPVARVVLVSCAAVYGESQSLPIAEEQPLSPITPLGASKASAELYARSYQRTYGLPVVVLRLFSTYGPRGHLGGPSGEVVQRFLVRALAGVAPSILGDGKQTRDFIYVTEAARGIVDCGACDALVGQAVNVARGEEVSIGELCRRILTVTGRSGLVPTLRAPRPADVRRQRAAIHKAERLAGFRAEIPLDDGLVRYLDWLKSSGQDPEQMLASDMERHWEPEAQA